MPAPPVLNGQFVNVNVLTPPAKTKGERENVGGRRAGQPRREGGRRLSEVEVESIKVSIRSAAITKLSNNCIQVYIEIKAFDSVYKK